MHRPSGDTKEMLPVRFCESSIALGNVRRDGCAGTVQLISEEVISLWKILSYRDDRLREIDGFLVNFEFLEQKSHEEFIASVSVFLNYSFWRVGVEIIPQ